jgi:glycosyltransferase involved in cell wall biosynthesis
MNSAIEHPAQYLIRDEFVPSAASGNRIEVEIVVPVYNEERVLSESIRRLHDFLTHQTRFSWQITIVDNASVDATPEIASALQSALSGVRFMRLEQKGRGRALRAAWTASRAGVVAYMDVDLSTDLRGLLPLVAPLLSGHSDVAIGSRLARGARVKRGAKREFISRSYNLILRAALHARFTDAQCGFKAVRRDVLGELLGEVRDENWFFDTELLVLAQRRGMRIHEVEVDWVDDPDSRVAIVPTALADLRGVARLLAASRLVRFAAIGLASTITYALLFVAFAGPLGSFGANALALTLTAVANTAANRRVTFGVRGREGLMSHHLAGFLVYLIALALTYGALAVMHQFDARPSHLLEALVLVLASLCATVTRYIALSTLVFNNRPKRRPRAAIVSLPTEGN